MFRFIILILGMLYLYNIISRRFGPQKADYQGSRSATKRGNSVKQPEAKKSEPNLSDEGEYIDYEELK